MARLKRMKIAPDEYSSACIRMNSSRDRSEHVKPRGDNILVTLNGYRVIDWQRPIIGPKELDFAALLISLHRDPSEFVDQSIVRIMYLLRIGWCTECALRWFPEGRDFYDRSIPRLINLVGAAA
jgi:hypothetical protein